MSRKSLEQRFWEKVDKTAGPDGCWPWTAGRNNHGYGNFWLGGTMRGAHRVAYELVTGEPIGPGVQVDHICHNPACCNPRHLRLATDKQTPAPPGQAGGGQGDPDLINGLGITGNGDLIEGWGLGRRPEDEAGLQGLSEGHTTSPAEPATAQGADLHRGSGASTTPEVTQPISRADAESLDKRLRAQVTELAHSFDRVVEVMTQARAGQVHLTLGFASWPAYVADVMKVWGRVPGTIRSSVVAFLDGEGMSQRAIAEATGLGLGTVNRQLASLQDEPSDQGSDSGVPHGTPALSDGDAGDSHESPVPEPKPEPVSPPITGRDGKTYRRRPPKPKPEPKPTPPGGITESTPGMTPAVEKALADAKAKATPAPQQGEEPDQEPVEDVSDIDAMVDQALADARTAPAPQQEEPKPVPEWSAAEKAAKFRLIWNCPEDEEEPEEVEDICVDNPEFYQTAGRVKGLVDGLLRYEPLPKTAWTGRKREFGETKYYDLIIDAVIMHFGVDTVAERLHHYQEATKKEEGQS